MVKNVLETPEIDDQSKQSKVFIVDLPTLLRFVLGILSSEALFIYCLDDYFSTTTTTPARITVTEISTE